jgi:hypothetical protein
VERLHDRVSYLAGRIPVQDPELGHKMHCGNVVIDIESFERAERALAERQALVEQPLRMDWDLDQMQAIVFST